MELRIGKLCLYARSCNRATDEMTDNRLRFQYLVKM